MREHGHVRLLNHDEDKGLLLRGFWAHISEQHANKRFKQNSGLHTPERRIDQDMSVPGSRLVVTDDTQIAVELFVSNDYPVAGGCRREIAYSSNPNFARQGYLKQAFSALISGFYDEQPWSSLLHCPSGGPLVLLAVVDSGNEPSKNFLVKSGFVKEAEVEGNARRDLDLHFVRCPCPICDGSSGCLTNEALLEAAKAAKEHAKSLAAQRKFTPLQGGVRKKTPAMQRVRSDSSSDGGY